MKRLLLILAALLLSGLAFADDYVASDGRDSVRLTEKPCPADILAAIQPQYRERVKAAVATVQGQEYRACWLASGGHVSLVYEDGDQGLVPLSEFRRSPGV